MDILPTILSGILKSEVNLNVDGVSHWHQMTKLSGDQHQQPPRTLMVYNIDDEIVPEIFNVKKLLVG